MTRNWKRRIEQRRTLTRSGGISKSAYDLVNLRALKLSTLYKNRIFQCMGKIFCAEFQSYPLKFHTDYCTLSLKDVSFVEKGIFKNFNIYEPVSVFETPHLIKDGIELINVYFQIFNKKILTTNYMLRIERK